MTDALELLGVFTAEQWGMVTSAQARDAGVDAVTVHRLKEAGFLEPVRRGVYAVTSAAVTGARDEQAAWLSLRPAVPAWERAALSGEDAVLSHASAARLHGLGDFPQSEIAMTTPRRRTSRDPGLWFKTTVLDDADVTLVDGLPVTTVLRTVCDLLDQLRDASHVATVIRQAVLADQLRLDELTDRIGVFARRYGLRAGDGAGLLDHLLEQIGTTPAELVVRPAPTHVQVAAANNTYRRLLNRFQLDNHLLQPVVAHNISPDFWRDLVAKFALRLPQLSQSTEPLAALILPALPAAAMPYAPRNDHGRRDRKDPDRA